MARGYGRTPDYSERDQEMDPEAYGLPAKIMLYTLDQIATMIEVNRTTLERAYIFYDTRSGGAPNRNYIIARDIAPPCPHEGEQCRKVECKREWRVTEREIIRWLRHKGFKFYRNSTLSH